MKKVIGLALLAAVSAPSAFATSAEYFVGGGLGYHSANTKLSYEGYSLKNDASGAAFHVRGGVYLEENHRLTLTANFTGDNTIISNSYEDGDWLKAELAQTEWLASYDYVHSINNEFSVFGGVTAGFTKNKLTASGEEWGRAFNESGSETDLTLGAQAGVQYKLTKNVSVDGTYRYMGTSWEEKESGLRAAVDNHSEFSISLDYRF
ncbi:porin family protein [Vibrio kyushuensis]|uniref:outer membrane beta-barrel protein n=1 Tax=Vibrio kyushuensis TaxID=2910249 RepID=UPI003D145302